MAEILLIKPNNAKKTYAFKSSVTHERLKHNAHIHGTDAMQATSANNVIKL